METIEFIIGQEKLQEYYDNGNIDGAIKEFSNFFEPEEFQELKQDVEIVSGMETYKDNNQRIEHLKKKHLIKKYLLIKYYVTI